MKSLLGLYIIKELSQRFPLLLKLISKTQYKNVVTVYSFLTI